MADADGRFFHRYRDEMLLACGIAAAAAFWQLQVSFDRVEPLRAMLWMFVTSALLALRRQAGCAAGPAFLACLRLTVYAGTGLYFLRHGLAALLAGQVGAAVLWGVALAWLVRSLLRQVASVR